MADSKGHPHTLGFRAFFDFFRRLVSVPEDISEMELASDKAPPVRFLLPLGESGDLDRDDDREA